MKFTLENTVKDIMEEKEIYRYLPLFFPQNYLDMLTEKDLECPIRELERIHSPWGTPFKTEDLVEAANILADILTDRRYTFLPLWKDETDGFLPDPYDRSREFVCLATTNTYTARKKPAVIICPGGGYAGTSCYNEGNQVAEALEKAGYMAFILLYRTRPNWYPEPQKDLALAVRYVRANAKRFAIDPDNIMLVGFSAGGHLAASYTVWEKEIGEELICDLEICAPALAEKYKTISGKPDKLCLGYSVISFTEFEFAPGFQNLTGGDESLREKLSVEKHVGTGWPKTFLWTLETDHVVPSANTKLMGEALKRADADYQMRIYPDGEHGCGLAKACSASVWTEELIRFMEPEMEKGEIPYEYFARNVAKDTWLIGCDCSDFGVRNGKSVDFGMPTGNSWMIVGEECAVLVDTAATVSGLRDFAEWIAQKPVCCVLSHAHPDHIYRVGEFDELWVHRDDIQLLFENGTADNRFQKPEKIPQNIHDISGIKVWKLSPSHTLEIIHFPGHSDGSILLYDRNTGLLFSGDSVGRRLLYGTQTYVPLHMYAENLKKLKDKKITGICSCHDRRIIVCGQINFMCEALKSLPDAEKEVKYTPDMEPLLSMSVGNETEMFYMNASYPKHLREKMQKEKDMLMKGEEING